MFRFKKSIPVAYNLQGYIYFSSRRYRDQPVKTRRLIEELCGKAGGEYQEALFEFVTTDAGAAEICAKHYLSESTLERVVKKYYLLWAQNL